MPSRSSPTSNPVCPSVVDSATAERGKASFDALRQNFDAQLQHLQQERDDAVDELDGGAELAGCRSGRDSPRARRRRRPVGAGDQNRGHAPARPHWPRRADESPRATSANRSCPRGPKTSARSPPTSRTCVSGSSTSSKPLDRREPTGRSGPRTAAVERRTRAVRLRRVARPSGAAAQGGVVLPADREAVRRQARRARHRVHRVRRRRRQAHAGPDQRSARHSPASVGSIRRAPTSTSTPRWTTRLENLDTAIAESGARDRPPGAAATADHGRPHPADDGVAEPHRQRGEVPARRRRATHRHRLRAELRTSPAAHGC